MTTVDLKNSLRGPIGPGKTHPPSSAESRLIDFKLSDLQKATAKLQTRLGPSSPLHNSRDASALRAAVLEVGKLIGCLSEFPGTASIKTKERIKEDWKLGWDGIVKEPAKGRKVEKPKLTLDEEDLLYS